MLLYGCSNNEHIFQLLDNNKAGIHFENTLKYSEEMNAYLFRGFYNGAGVALADLNNDGNLDLFLCGNQVSNKLYLGDSKFNFNDITKASGIEQYNSWTTGVSIVDINEDGWKDIYLCKSGPLGGPNRRNQLFINQGIDAKGQLTFVESAAKYGIDDSGFSIHAIFLDYDRDGDLDMYLSNNSQYPGDQIVNAVQGMREKRNGGTKLYKNVGNKFIDVTAEAGIYDSPIGFGLGIAAGDVNRDGWPDLYVANDFFEKDYLYINQHNGTFTESIDTATNEISLGSMGVDISDLNHDGYPEIFVSEMLPEDEERIKTKTVFDNWDEYSIRLQNGYHRQFPRNTLQLNMGKSSADSLTHFSEISRYANVAASDWSWGVQMADFDNDGEKEIFITNGIAKDLLDRDFLAYYDNPDTLKKMFKANGSVMSELFDHMPSKPIPNCLFKIDSDLVFRNVANDFGVAQPGYSSGSAYGDIDNDGDLDLIVNNVNGPPFIYKNESNKKNNHFISLALKKSNGVTAIGAQVSIWAGGKLFFDEVYPMKGVMSVCDDKLLMGLGKINKIDSIEIQWPTGEIYKQGSIAVDQFITIRQTVNNSIVSNNANQVNPLFSKVNSLERLGIDFCHRESNYVDFDKDNLLFQMYSNEGPKLAVGDINGDGLDDFFVGGAKGQPGAIYKQNAKSFIRTNEAVMKLSDNAEDQHALFFDADNDGDQDLIVTSGSYEFPDGSFDLTNKLYINDGKGNFAVSPQILPPGIPSSTSVIIAADYDHDGDLDLFIGGRFVQGSYGVPASSHLLQNKGKGVFTDVTQTSAPGLLNIGMVTDAIWSDFDKDGDPDLIVVGEWMPIKVFANTNGQFKEVRMDALDKSNGFWNTITKVDLDGDGDDDFVVGNMGYNTFFKATPDQPVQMYVNDFDKNGKIDQITTCYRDGKSYPVVMKDVLTKQMPYLLKKYLNFSSYQGQTIDKIFSKEELKGSLVLQVYETATSVLWNDGGKFTKQPLPYQAQLAPTYAINCMDINKDGFEDIILGGNQYNAQPQTGIYAGSYGSVLINKGGKEFQSVGAQQSGFFVNGQIRDLKKITVQGKSMLLVAKNNDSLEIFEMNKR